MRRRRDAHHPGRAGLQQRRRARRHRIGRLVADDLIRIGRHRRIDRHLAQELAIAVEDLDAAVAAVGNIDVSGGVRRDAMCRAELAGSVAAIAPGFDPEPVLVVDASKARCLRPMLLACVRTPCRPGHQGGTSPPCRSPFDRPDIVVRIQILADLAHELAVRPAFPGASLPAPGRARQAPSRHGPLTPKSSETDWLRRASTA